MLWKNVSRLDWCLLGHLLFGTWGPIIAGTAIIPAILGAMLVLAISGDEEVSFLKIRKKGGWSLGQPPFEYDIIVL